MKPRCSNAAVRSLQGLVKQLKSSQHQVVTWNGKCWHHLFHHGWCCQVNLIWMQNNHMIASVRCVLAIFWSKFKSSCTYIRGPQQKTNEWVISAEYAPGCKMNSGMAHGKFSSTVLIHCHGCHKLELHPRWQLVVHEFPPDGLCAMSLTFRKCLTLERIRKLILRD